MYTPYNIFNPEIKKYQTGTAATTGNTTTTPDKPQIQVGTIFTKDGKTYRVSEVRSQTDFDAEDITDKRNIAVDKSSVNKYKDRGINIDFGNVGETRYVDEQPAEATAGRFGDATKNEQGWKDTWKGVYPDYDKLVESLPKRYPDNVNPEVKKFQQWLNETYIPNNVKAINEQRVKAGHKPLSTEESKTLENDLKADYGFDPSKKGKGYDGKWGTFTSSRRPLNYTIDPIEPTKPNIPATNEPVNFITAGKFQQPPLPRRKPEFWKQDLVSMINAGMDWASIKKYLPWAKPIDLEEPQYALLDPTWQLQQNAGLLNQQIEGLGAFGTPQSYMANLTGAAGKASENAQRILADYDTKNAMIQNEGENRKTAVRNQEEMTNAEIATNLYDKTTIANQQFDNAQRAARNNMALAYNNALTNRALTQAQNLMSAPFQVDPTTGGYVFFDPNLATEMAPSQSDYEIRKQRLDQILKDPAYKNIEDKESIYRMLYPDENFGYPGTRQNTRRTRQQQYQPSYFDMMRMMYPGATGGDPYGYIG